MNVLQRKRQGHAEGHPIDAVPFAPQRWSLDEYQTEVSLPEQQQGPAPPAIQRGDYAARSTPYGGQSLWVCLTIEGWDLQYITIHFGEIMEEIQPV
ncbi:hypothetical protein VTO42DRAFT_3005 [Malbranchea cinnamomea]